jgi:hypothetical protein
MRQATMQHRFVEFIPEVLEDGVLYVSLEYTTATHRCCCGCGAEVVTPLSPTDWRLIFDGKTASLEPSIGNWSLPCRSHYWITRNHVRWAPAWSEDQIAAGRAYDARAKRDYYDAADDKRAPQPTTPSLPKPTLWTRFWNWWS